MHSVKINLLVFALLLLAAPILALQEKPEGEPTFPQVNMTAYYTPYENDFIKWYTGAQPCQDSRGYCCIPMANRGFFESVKCQGSGVSNDGKLYRYDKISTTKESSEPDDSGFSNGITATGTEPIPHHTIAVNPDVGTPCYIPYGSLVYVEFPQENNPWNGWYVAEDTGSAFHGKCKIDIFAGVGKEAYNNAKQYISGFAKVWVFDSEGNILKGNDFLTAYGIGSYNLQPSFHVKNDYDLSVYETIKKQASELVKECALEHDIEQCINRKMNEYNSIASLPEWSFSKDEHAEKVFNHILEKMQDCMNSADFNCTCRFSLDHGSGYDVDGEYKINITTNAEGALFMIAKPEADLTQTIQNVSFHFISQEYYGGEPFLEPQQNILLKMEYGNDGNIGGTIDSGGDVYIDLSSGRVSLNDKKKHELIFYKKDYENISFVDDDAFYDSDQAYGALPECRIDKRTYRFSVRSSDKKYFVFDYIKDKFELKDIYVNFALFIKDLLPPPPARIISVSYEQHSEDTLLLKFKASEAPDIDNYNIFYSQNDFRQLDETLSNKSFSTENTEKYYAINLERAQLVDEGPFKKVKYPSKKEESSPEELISLEEDKAYYISSDDSYIFKIRGLTEPLYYFSINPSDFNKNINQTAETTPGQTVDVLPPNYIQLTGTTNAVGESNKIKLIWDAPTHNMDGSQIVDLDGFAIYMSPEPFSFDTAQRRTISIDDTTPPLEPLPEGQEVYYDVPVAQNGVKYCFVITALDEQGNEISLDNLLDVVEPKCAISLDG